VGFTKFATRMLGELVEMVLEVTPGQTVGGGERLGTVEGFKAVSDLFCVVDGTLSAVNPALTAEACLTHSDPYGAGWLYAVQGTPTPGHLDVHGYIALLTATIDQLQASRYSDGDGHTAAEPAQSDEPEPGDDA
jgi:glycine cleavage system H protein